MTNAKHTPGPWQINNSKPFQICDADGEGRGCAPIATVANFGTTAEKIANARLIAATPDLLAALEGLCGLAECRPGYLHDYKAAVADARAAIAKAKGE